MLLEGNFMGTNFYGRKREVHYPLTFTAMNHESLIEVYNYIENLLELTNIHLGKCSAGWDFIAQMNDSIYYTNKEEYLNFCKTLEIRDEYGALIYFEKFLEMVNIPKGKRHLDTGITEDGLEFYNYEFS